jgi:hypothetical protein
MPSSRPSATPFKRCPVTAGHDWDDPVVAGVLTAPAPSSSPRCGARGPTRSAGVRPWSLQLVAVGIRAFPGLSAHLYVLHSLRDAVMAFGSTLHYPQLSSRPPSTHTSWSGRGSWRPGGARHCTNDLDAMGRVCSASPGSTVVGTGALPRTTPTDPQPGMAPPPSRCWPIPRRRHCPDRGPRSAVIASYPPALPTCGRASAQRGRSGPKAGASPAAEPGSAPGGAERSRGLNP